MGNIPQCSIVVLAAFGALTRLGVGTGVIASTFIILFASVAGVAALVLGFIGHEHDAKRFEREYRGDNNKAANDAAKRDAQSGGPEKEPEARATSSP